jgi:putative transcriptional regulator
LYNRIKETRVDKQIKQEVLAYEAGIARSTLSMIETVAHIPKVDTAIRIARALNTIVEDLWII